MGKASIRTTLTLKLFKWTEHILLLLYQFLLMMTLSEYANSKYKASIAAMQSLQYVCHLEHVTHLLQPPNGKVTFSIKGQKCNGFLIMNSTSVSHSFQSQSKHANLKITLFSPYPHNVQNMSPLTFIHRVTEYDVNILMLKSPILCSLDLRHHIKFYIR